MRHAFSGAQAGVTTPNRFAAASASGTEQELGEPQGPAIDLEIVGVVRSPWFSDYGDTTRGAVIPSAGVLALHRENLTGHDEQIFFNALVRLEDGAEGIPAFREQLKAGLGEKLVLNGHPEKRLPNTLNVSFLGHIGSELLAKVPGIAASTGSACHEGKIARSPVLCAMNAPLEVNHGAVRLTVGRFTTEEEVDRAAEMLINAATA